MTIYETYITRKTNPIRMHLPARTAEDLEGIIVRVFLGVLRPQLGHTGGRRQQWNWNYQTGTTASPL
jgi:hypothetical protein